MNLKQLRHRCQMPFEMFEGEVMESKTGRHLFLDRGGSVLAVAHLDYVGASKHFERATLDGQEHIFSMALDDRLGAYLLLDELPKLGLNFDVLLTEGEESMNSTASDFVPPKEYNWLFSFDRAGTDVVMYDYEDTQMKTLLKSSGFDVGFGSYSDICDLESLGCKAFNFGTGYYENHTRLSYMLPTLTSLMVNKFVPFFLANQEIKYPHEELPIGNYARFHWHKHDMLNWEEIEEPDRGDTGKTHEAYFCDDCGQSVDEDTWFRNQGFCNVCAAVEDAYYLKMKKRK
jgi:hypothetical protein